MLAPACDRPAALVFLLFFTDASRCSRPAFVEAGRGRARRRRHAAGNPALERSLRRWRRAALGVLLTGPFLGVLDLFIVNVSLPTIRDSLGASFAQVEWTVTGYGLAYALLLIIGGRLGDLFGRRRVFCLGLAGFTLTSAFCGTAATPWALIGWRVAQGATAAVMFPQALSFIQARFPADERRGAFSVYGANLGLASVCGQIFGGLLLAWNLYDLSWRPVFLVNVPIGLIGLVIAWTILREPAGLPVQAPALRMMDTPPSSLARRLDLGGAGLIALALLLLTFPLVEGGEAGWPWWAFVSLAAAGPMFLVFDRFERRVAARGGVPLVDPGLWRDGAFVTALWVTLAYFAGHAAMLLMLSLFLQSGLQLSPLWAGLTLVPFSAGFATGSTFSGKLMARFSTRALHLGAAVSTVGIGIMLWEAGRSVVGKYPLEFTGGILLYGIGRGFVSAPLFSVVLGRIRHGGEAGAAAGVLSTVQQIAHSAGLAAIGVLLFGALPAAPGASDYTRAFVLAGVINLLLLAIASRAHPPAAQAWGKMKGTVQPSL